MDALYETFSSRRDVYIRCLDRALDECAEKKDFPRVPPLLGLRRHLEGHFFHMTPEVFFQIHGRVLFELPSEEFYLRPAQVCLIPTGMPHRETRFVDKNGLLQIVMMFQQKSFSLHLVHTLADKKQVTASAVDFFPTSHRNQILDYLDHMSEAGDLPECDLGKFHKGLFQSLVVLLRNIITTSSEPTYNVPFKIARCLGVVNSSLPDPKLTVQGIARSINCSPDYLSRLFRQHMDVNLNEYINQRRISMVKDMLQNSDLSIKEIAWSTGFKDPAYMNRIFKSHTGITPNSFRKQTQTQEMSS